MVMAKTNAKSVMRWIALGIGVTILFLLAGAVAGMIETTLIDFRIFFGIVAVVAAATGTVLHRAWGRLTGTSKFYINYPIHLVVSAIVLSAAVLMGNYYPTDFSLLPEEKVIIDQRLRKTRYKTRRVSRRVYTRGAPYQVYYLKVALPDGKRKQIYVNKALYDKARQGDTATVRVGRGKLSFPVMDPNSLKLLHPHTGKKNTGRCKFFGTTRK